jgi:hypothetical protein
MILASAVVTSVRWSAPLAARWPVFARALGLGLLCASIGAVLPGCAWLDLKQRELALRPTPGRPASLPPDAQ